MFILTQAFTNIWIKTLFQWQNYFNYD